MNSELHVIDFAKMSENGQCLKNGIFVGMIT